MMWIGLLILLALIGASLPTNISSDHVLIIASCQADQIGMKSVPFASTVPSHFYLSRDSSLALPSSSSLLHLSYCEHQQTSYYSLSGFSILLSSPRLPRTNTIEKKLPPSFDHNVVHAATDQSSSSTTTIITLTSSTSNSNQTFQTNMISTTIASNVSLLSSTVTRATTTTTTIQRGFLKIDRMLLLGCVLIGITFLIIIYAIIKYCKRDEGSYKIDESKNFSTKLHLNNPNHSDNKPLSIPSNQKMLISTGQRITDSKEWYV